MTILYKGYEVNIVKADIKTGVCTIEAEVNLIDLRGMRDHIDRQFSKAAGIKIEKRKRKEKS
jgi:hypothetical protein